MAANPNDVTDVYRLAIAFLEQAPPNVQGFWYAARAAGLAPAQAQAQIANYGRAKYRHFHGDEEGWPGILEQAKTQPNPPAGFSVSPAPTPAEMAAKLVASKPVNQMSFDEIQMILTAGNQQAADQAWGQLKGKPTQFIGKAVDVTKTKLLLAATYDNIQANKADVELNMGGPIPANLMPKVGDEVKVQGIPATYEAQPFMIHMEEGAFLTTPKVTPKPPPRPPARRGTTASTRHTKPPQ